MGLFGGKKTYVSSSLYNLAGDEEARPDYLKNLVIGNLVGRNRGSMPEILQQGYLNGPGIKLRRFVRWATENYDLIGVPTSTFQASASADSEVVAGEIPHDNDERVRVENVIIGPADFVFWAEQWMYENYPDEVDSDWISDYDDATGMIVVTRQNNSVYSFLPEDFDRNATYVCAAYTLIDDDDGSIIAVKVFIYRIGNGNSNLDSLVGDYDVVGLSNVYAPFIPVRLDNKFLSETYNPEGYALAKKAYKKALGANIDTVVEQLKDNESLGDIDYAYVMFGVPLNTRDDSAKKYLYTFFDMLRGRQETQLGDYEDWKNNADQHQAETEAWQEWYLAQQDPSDPRYGDPEPSIVPYSVLPATEVRVSSSGSLNTNVDLRISWQSIQEITGTGEGKPGAKKGDIWLQNGISDDINNVVIDDLEIGWQTDDASWKKLVIKGMVHRNYIYNGKFVEIGTNEALADAEESGFLVPIHYGIFTSISLVDATQLSTACAYLVLNSYKVVKQKWYQTGIFKIALFVAVIAITVATGGTGAASIGLLGTNAAVGTAIGLTGTAAVIAGAVANALVAMILLKAISIGAVAIFGEKLGAIIGVIAGLVTLQVGTALQSGASLASSFGVLMRAENIISITSAVGGGIAGYIQAGARETAEKTQSLVRDYAKQSKEISDLYEKNIGYNRAELDPLALMGDGQQVNIESMSGFLQRTLMTGSDVADLSLGLLSNFSEITLSTDLNL